MKTSAQRDLDQERQAETRDHAERIVSVNEAYDAQALSLRCWKDLEAECNRQHRFAVERQAVIDDIERICLQLNNPSVNLATHRVVNTILQRIRRQ